MPSKKLEKGRQVTKTEFARLTGKTVRTISKYEADGMPSLKAGSGSHNRINTADAITWLENRAVQKRAPVKGGAVTIDRERLRLISEQADEKAIRNSVGRGELISAEYVNEFAMTSVANLVATLSGLAGRMANEVARVDDPAKCRELLKREIDRARVQFADSFDQLAESFDDRAATVVDSQAVAR